MGGRSGVNWLVTKAALDVEQEWNELVSHDKSSSVCGAGIV